MKKESNHLQFSSFRSKTIECSSLVHVFLFSNLVIVAEIDRSHDLTTMKKLTYIYITNSYLFIDN